MNPAQVEVEGPDDEVRVFPCHGWLGSSDDGSVEAPYERHLIPVTADSLQPQTRLPPRSISYAGVAFPHPQKVRACGSGAPSTATEYMSNILLWLGFRINRALVPFRAFTRVQLSLRTLSALFMRCHSWRALLVRCSADCGTCCHAMRCH